MFLDLALVCVSWCRVRLSPFPAPTSTYNTGCSCLVSPIPSLGFHESVGTATQHSLPLGLACTHTGGYYNLFVQPQRTPNWPSPSPSLRVCWRVPSLPSPPSAPVLMCSRSCCSLAEVSPKIPCLLLSAGSRKCYSLAKRGVAYSPVLTLTGGCCGPIWPVPPPLASVLLCIGVWPDPGRPSRFPLLIHPIPAPLIIYGEMVQSLESPRNYFIHVKQTLSSPHSDLS